MDLTPPGRRLARAAHLLKEAIERTRGLAPGPVHVNVPLREPLYPELTRSETAPSAARGQPTPPDRIDVLPSSPQLTPQAWDDLLAAWQLATRKLIVAGMHPPEPVLRQALRSLSQQPDVAVVADITANVFPEGTPLHHWDAILGTKDEADAALPCGRIW